MMNQSEHGASGILYIVATPIGNLSDIIQRAIEVLQQVSAIAVEDTRHSRKLLEHFNISTPMLAYHDFNETHIVSSLIDRLLGGEDLALISDAGTPLISDPGYQLVSQAQEQNIRVVPIPGPSAAIAALSCSGLPSDRFTFEGFLSAKAGARKTALQALQNESRTMIFYEAPHRILACLQDMVSVFGSQRKAVVARELTKKYETVKSDTLENLLTFINDDPNQQRGEFVVSVAGIEKNKDSLTDESLKLLRLLITEMPLKQAAAICAKATGIKKKLLYDAGLKLKEENN